MSEMQEFSRLIKEFFDVEPPRREEGTPKIERILRKRDNREEIKSVINDGTGDKLPEHRDTISCN